MDRYDYNYVFPADFDNRMRQLLQQYYRDNRLAEAFEQCAYEYDNVGNAFRAGIKGDNWNMEALDFIVEGPRQHASIIRDNIAVVRKAIEKALRPSRSGFQLRDLVCLDSNEASPSFATNDDRLSADVVSAEAVLLDIVEIAASLSINTTYTGNSLEDSINDYVRDALKHKGYGELRDQTRHGLSVSGKRAGEVDLLLSKDGKEVALLEAMKLGHVDAPVIDRHIAKATTSYNPLGTATFVIAYVHSADFEGFWNRYVSYLEQYDFNLHVKRTLEIRAYPNAASRIAQTVLSRDGYDFPVYFVAIKLTACQ